MSRNTQQEILNYILEQPGSSSSQIHEALPIEVSYATVKRTLARLQKEKMIA